MNKLGVIGFLIIVLGILFVLVAQNFMAELAFPIIFGGVFLILIGIIVLGWWACSKNNL